MNMQRHLRIAAIVLGSAALVLGLNLASAETGTSAKADPGKTAAKSGGTTLYDRLGGMKGIEELSDHFVATLYAPVNRTASNGTAGVKKETADHVAKPATRTTVTTGTSSTEGTAGSVASTTSIETKPSIPEGNTGATSTNTAQGGNVASKDMKTGEMDHTQMGVGASSAAEAKNEDPREVLRTYVAARICVVGGGTCQEPSVPLSTLRGRVHASNQQWTHAMNDLRSTLDKRGISKSDREEVMTSLTTLMRDTSGHEIGMSHSGTHHAKMKTGDARTSKSSTTGTTNKPGY